MRCVVCGRDEDHCKVCHFVHDHMGLLDHTTVGANNSRLINHTPPWKVSSAIARWVREDWEKYEVPDASFTH